jgi:PAS domain S-box-containing protein
VHVATPSAAPEDVNLFHRASMSLRRDWPFLADAAGGIVLVDSGWLALIGASVEAVRDMGIFAGLHGEHADALRAGWLRAVESDGTHESEGLVRCAGGASRWLRIQATKIPGQSGAARWFGTIEDVDQFHRLNDEAIAAHQRYVLAARATQDLVWDHDFCTNHIHLGEALSTVFGHAISSQCTTPAWWLDLFHPEDRAMVADSWDAACAGTKTDWQCHYRLRRADGSYAFVSNCAFIVRDAQGFAVRAVGAVSDLSAQHEAQQHLSELQSELIGLSRDNAMGLLGAMLAHELNQPLTAVIGFVRGAQRLLTLRDAEALSQARAAMDAAAENTLAAGTIVRRLRDFVAQGTSTIAVHDLPAIIEDACALALLDAHKWSITREVVLDPAARRIAADRVQVQQVLINLLRNAIEAMQGTPRRTLKIETVAEGQHARICVEDTGPGIPPDRQGSLFQRGSSSKPGGIGIGLSICKIIVEAGGGNIWLDRSDNTGTTLCFTIPLAVTED